MLASPQEHIQARELLQGKNLMPYLNKTDRQIVDKQFRKFGHLRQAGGGSKFDHQKNLQQIKILTKNQSKNARLDVEMRNRTLEETGQTHRLLADPVPLGYKAEQMKQIKRSDAREMLSMMLKKDSSVVALDAHIKGSTLPKQPFQTNQQKSKSKTKRNKQKKREERGGGEAQGGDEAH